MSAFPKSVHISEEGPREGFQIEKNVIPTERKVELIDALSETGLKQIQIAAFVNPKQVPGMADSEEVVRMINVKPGVAYGALWFNLKGLDRARNTNRLTLLGKIRMFPSDAFLAANLKRTAEEHIKTVHQEMDEFKAQGIPVDRISITSAFGCNFQGEIKPERVMSDIAQARDIADQHDLKIGMVSLAESAVCKREVGVGLGPCGAVLEAAFEGLHGAAEIFALQAQIAHAEARFLFLRRPLQHLLIVAFRLFELAGVFEQ